MPVRFRIENPALAVPLRQIEHLVRRAGGRLWLVGGCVRDLILERQPRDLDLEVSGIPPGQLHAILTEHFSVQFVGRAFGVFKLDGLSIDVSAGDYRVEVKGLDVDGFRTVSRLRVVRRDVPAPARGDVIGETGTDSGQIAVCDIAAFGAAVGTDADLVERAVRDVGKTPFGTLVIAGIDVVFCITGSDGGGPVHALLDGATVVGIELPFVDTMQAYR